MPKMADIADRMRYWCEEGNLGYDQGNRWDIRVGGECDCSSLVLWCVWEAGYMSSKPTWGNTDSMWSQLSKLGFTRKTASKSNPPKGVIRLRPGHTAVSMGNGKVAQASIDENGKITGGKSGDQTGKETKVSTDPCNWTWDIYATGAAVSTSPSTTTSGGFKVYGFELVKSGSKGNAVKVCQAALNVRNGAGLKVDGEAGSNTVSAIKAWQTKKGLSVDGQCGPNTWQSLLGV